MLTPSTVLQGRYRVDQVLGQGAMGTVYLATEEALGGKRVAIKEMDAMLSTSDGEGLASEQFMNEAQLLASLRHPGLVDVTHFFTEGDRMYLVMDYVEGVTIERLLMDSKDFIDVPTVLEWAEQTAIILEYLHRHDPPVLFRDLKSSNIMLDIEGRVRLIDFGIAGRLDASLASPLPRGAGSPGFAPLEQFADVSDPRADLYALGATLYHMLTRTIPPSSVDLATGEETLEPPSSVNPAVPLAVDALVLKLMAVLAEDRFQTTRDTLKALRLARRRLTQGARPRFCADCGAPVKKEDRCRLCGATLQRLPPGKSTGNLAAPPDLAIVAKPASKPSAAATPPPPDPPTLVPARPSYPARPYTMGARPSMPAPSRPPAEPVPAPAPSAPLVVATGKAGQELARLAKRLKPVVPPVLAAVVPAGRVLDFFVPRTRNTDGLELTVLELTPERVRFDANRCYSGTMRLRLTLPMLRTGVSVEVDVKMYIETNRQTGPSTWRHEAILKGVPAGTWTLIHQFNTQERRQTSRLKVDLAASLQRFAARTTLHDISPEGISFIGATHLGAPTSTELVLDLPGSPGGGSLFVVRVRYGKRLETGEYRHGGLFESMSEPAAAALLMFLTRHYPPDTSS